jgi:FMN reductase
MTVIIAGNPRPQSRTRRLAEAFGAALTDRLDRPGPVVVDVAELGAALWTPEDPAVAEAIERIRAAEPLIIAMPTYKGSYPGVLKVLLDLLPHQGLRGVKVITIVTAGVEAQATAAEALLHQLLGELGATVVNPGVRLTEGQLDDPQLAVRHAEQLAAALGAPADETHLEVPA